MKVGDMVKYEGASFVCKVESTSIGIIVAELPNEGILNAAVSVLWASGEFVERVPHRILEVISESR
jgi:hypothetical protein